MGYEKHNKGLSQGFKRHLERNNYKFNEKFLVRIRRQAELGMTVKFLT